MRKSRGDQQLKSWGAEDTRNAWINVGASVCVSAFSNAYDCVCVWLCAFVRICVCVCMPILCACAYVCVYMSVRACLHIVRVCVSVVYGQMLSFVPTY